MTPERLAEIRSRREFVMQSVLNAAVQNPAVNGTAVLNQLVGRDLYHLLAEIDRLTVERDSVIAAIKECGEATLEYCKSLPSHPVLDAALDNLKANMARL